MSFHEVSQCNDRQQYNQNITSQNASSFNTYVRKKDNLSNIHSGIPTTSRKYVPIVRNKPVQEIHMKNIPLSSGSSIT